jgi:hypothetical protein
VRTGDLDLTDGESGEDEAFGKRTQRRIDENDAEMARRVREVAARARANGTARTVPAVYFSPRNRSIAVCTRNAIRSVVAVDSANVRLPAHPSYSS